VSRVILVTGASSGIGGATASHLAALGHRVYAASRRGTLHQASDALPLKVNVDHDLSVAEAIETVRNQEGRIDVVVNCAGFGIAGAIEDTPVALAQAQFNTNVFGVMRVCRSVLPVMRSQGRGLIVNVTSIAGELSLPFQGLYSASKFAVEGMSDALRVEVRPFGIDVVLVQPGDFRTGFTAARQVATNDQSAYSARAGRALAIAASDENAGADPRQVAQLIGRIVLNSRPRARYVVGPAAQEWLMRLRHVLPGRWLMARHFGG
jgi:NAD(P)-dependent dehydrogenase (short-subunit alcohol dehydrogenase family)